MRLTIALIDPSRLRWPFWFGVCKRRDCLEKSVHSLHPIVILKTLSFKSERDDLKENISHPSFRGSYVQITKWGKPKRIFVIGYAMSNLKTPSTISICKWGPSDRTKTTLWRMCSDDELFSLEWLNYFTIHYSNCLFIYTRRNCPTKTY